MLRVLNVCGAFLCALGSMLSGYAYYVETRKEHDIDFTALCDISEHISCSKVFTSKFGTGFGMMHLIFGDDSILNQPNPVYGLIFYCLQMMLGQFDNLWTSKIQIYMAIIANFGSVYLAYILYFILYDFCIVCISTYIVNALLLIYCIKRQQILRYLSSAVDKKKY